MIYPEFGVGSALAGAACAWLPRRFELRLRYLAFAATLFVGMVALAVLPVPVGVAVAGVTVAPYLICLYGFTERLGSRAQAATIMTVLCAGGPLGTRPAAPFPGGWPTFVAVRARFWPRRSSPVRLWSSRPGL